MPPGAVYVGRPSRWGNPFHTLLDGTRASRGFATAMYRLWVTGQLIPELAALFQGCDPMPEPPTLMEIRLHLRGRDLVCWCPLDEPCHADVLLELANS